MKTVTLEQFLTFRPCWLDEDGGRERLERIAARKKEWTALDVLRLPDKEVSPKEKLWAVLREEFIDALTLQTFMCLCMKRAQKNAVDIDRWQNNAIKAKSLWPESNIINDEFAAMWDAAWKVIGWVTLAAASNSEAAKAWAVAGYTASVAAWDVAGRKVATENAARYGIERRWQCEKLIELLESEGIK